LVFTPVYNAFFDVIKHSERNILTASLIIKNEGDYAINWQDFDKADYDTLFMQEEKTLEKNVLAKHTVWVKPEGTASLNVPLDKETQFVAIIGQFYHPDEKSDSWRLVIKRDELEADKPRSIELMRSDLRLLPLKDK
ncbi:type VI secretion system lipoprotein TssJ, partial [Escherichia coli]